MKHWWLTDEWVADVFSQEAAGTMPNVRKWNKIGRLITASVPIMFALFFILLSIIKSEAEWLVFAAFAPLLYVILSAFRFSNWGCEKFHKKYHYEKTIQSGGVEYWCGHPKHYSSVSVVKSCRICE